MATRRVDELAFDHGAQYFTARDPRFHKEVTSWLAEGHAQEWHGSIGVARHGLFEPKEASPIRYVGTPRMSAITRHMATNLDITFNTRVHAAELDSNRWLLFDENQSKLGCFDALIITTPPLQALPFLAQFPSLKKEVVHAKMLPCWAAMVSFEYPLSIPHDGLFVQNSALSWICRNNSKPGRPQIESWVLHGSPEWSTRHVELEAPEALARLVTAFSKATGLDMPSPVFAKAHRWRYAIAESPLHLGCLWDKDNKLAVCGDWCNGSRIEGAFLSGVAAADRIVNHFEHLETLK